VRALRYLVAVSLALVALAGVKAGPASASPAYTIADLGTLGGTYSVAAAINNAGAIVGESATSFQTHAFLYDAGGMTDLGSIGGANTYSSADAINSAGQIVGYANVAPGVYHAFLYSAGSMKDLGSLSGFSAATAINGKGQIVGNSTSSSGSLAPFLYHDGAMTNLNDLLPQGSNWTLFSAQDINARGQIVGLGFDGSRSRAYLYTLTTGTAAASISDLGALDVASAINNAGEVVGASNLHAALYKSGTITDLGSLGGSSIATAINNKELVVGWSYISPNSDEQRPFLYSQGTMTDLNSLLPANSGWVLYSARDINDRGQIVGQGLINGEPHAFLMTPAG
jgi:probable HAF family extracellular repeat protein